MGMNLRSCCHKCKEQVFHYRGKENETMLPFYRKHYSCMKENPDNPETVLCADLLAPEGYGEIIGGSQR